MAQYRLPALDLPTRLSLAVEMLTPLPQRPWGRVSHLAQTYGVSRTWLYGLRDQAEAALGPALAPHPPGPSPQTQTLMIDDAFLRRAITVLPMLTGSVRGIQQGLALLLKVQRSVGYISQTLQAAGTAATAYNTALSVPLPILGEADEIFQGRQPCLTVVDGRAFLVVHLSLAPARDATHWGVTFLDLQERGIQFHDLVSDGARGIQAGVQEAQLAIPLRPDLFHLLQQAHRISRRLERAAYRAIGEAERVRRAHREAQAPKRRRGKPLAVTLSLAQAEVQEAEALVLSDLWVWLIGEVRQALEPISPQGGVTRVAQARATVQTAAELLMALPHTEVTAFAQHLLAHLEALLAPLGWLEEYLAPGREGLEAPTEALIVWAWQHRHPLALQVGEGFPASLHLVVRAFWEGLSLFHRSSSLAEALHSWLRPHLQIHRGAPKWLLPLLQLFWNHHPFQRGKRAGHSPLEWAGVPDAPSLAEVLERLWQPQASAEGGASSLRVAA